MLKREEIVLEQQLEGEVLGGCSFICEYFFSIYSRSEAFLFLDIAQQREIIYHVSLSAWPGAMEFRFSLSVG